MPIEFPCSGCGQQLRVGDGDGGRPARCPQCGAITHAPVAKAAFPSTSDQSAEIVRPGEEPNPYASPPLYHGEVTSPQRSYIAPHRGTNILVLGILSVTCCTLCGPFAWIMGSKDMKAIREGYMDPSGKTQTQVGMILGIIGTILGGCSIVVQVIALMADV